MIKFYKVMKRTGLGSEYEASERVDVACSDAIVERVEREQRYGGSIVTLRVSPDVGRIVAGMLSAMVERGIISAKDAFELIYEDAKFLGEDED